MYTQVTEGISISVKPAHLEDNSDPLNSVYAFSYTIRIENLSSEAVQLLERHWLITSGGVQIAEVVGPGVVGVQPLLEAGEAFEYSSGAVINDPVGWMEGSYTFRVKDGRFFQVPIPRFDLLYPIMLH